MSEDKDFSRGFGWWLINGFCWLGVFIGLGMVLGLIGFDENPNASRVGDIIVGVIVIAIMAVMIKTFSGKD